MAPEGHHCSPQWRSCEDDHPSECPDGDNSWGHTCSQTTHTCQQHSHHCHGACQDPRGVAGERPSNRLHSGMWLRPSVWWFNVVKTLVPTGNAGKCEEMQELPLHAHQAGVPQFPLAGNLQEREGPGARPARELAALVTCPVNVISPVSLAMCMFVSRTQR